MASFKTRTIPTYKAPKAGVAKPAKMPALKAPAAMRSLSVSASMPTIRAAAGHARTAPVSPGSNAIAKAASSSSATAAAPSFAGAGWRNQGRTRRPQQDSPFGFLGQ